MNQEIEKLIRKYERQAERCYTKESLMGQKKDRLSVHGYWDLGYFGGRATLYEDVVDDLKELLDEISKKENIPFGIPSMEKFEKNFTVHKNEKILLGSISICELHGSCLGKKVGFYIVEDDVSTVIYPLSNHDSFLISYTKLREFN